MIRSQAHKQSLELVRERAVVAANRHGQMVAAAGRGFCAAAIVKGIFYNDGRERTAFVDGYIDGIKLHNASQEMAK